MIFRIQTIYAAGLCMATMLPAPALADWSLAGSVALTSDYRYRGLSQNDRHIAPQGSLNLNSSDGWYIGNWASKIDFNDAAGTSIEWDIYAGKHFDLGDGFDLNIEPYYYAYPDHDSKITGFRYSFFEMINTLTKSFDKLTLTGIVAWSPDFFGQTGTGWWVAGNATYAITDWLSVSGNVAHQWAADLDKINGIGWPYTEYDIGFTGTYKNFALDVRYLDTSISKNECATFNGYGNRHWCGGTFLATLTFNFTVF